MTITAPSMIAMSATLKNAGPQWADSNVHEVDDLSEGEAIPEIGGPARHEQSESHEG
jgi:hypothetical protein